MPRSWVCSLKKGPDLKRPYVGRIEGSNKIPNLKELVIQVAGNPYRVFFMFDERGVAILLLGARRIGGKKAQAAWYKARIAEVEPIFEQYVAELKNGCYRTCLDTDHLPS